MRKHESDNSAQVPWGLSADTGRMMHVDDVPNGKSSGCVCPVCWGSLVARQGRVRKHHFAHSVESCNGESWLHETAKRLLFQRLSEEQPVPVSWGCDVCRCSHEHSLSGIVSMEKQLGTIRPDIHVERGGQPKALLEVVYKHAPADAVQDYARDNQIPLMQFDVATIEDLDRVILAPVLEPAIQYVRCLCPLCDRCGQARKCDDDHRWCERCQSCVTDVQGQYGGYGDHRHCRVCGDVMTWTKGDWPQHYCCSFTHKYNRPLCADRDLPHPLNATHGHCTACGSRVTKRNHFGEFFNPCWNCHETARKHSGAL